MEHDTRTFSAETDRIESLSLDTAVVCPVGRRGHRDGIAVISDVPESLPVTAEEIGLLRAFLRDEISAILHGDDGPRK
ncbi:hypothetical protein G6N76_02145 [Rhizobium daejeonense]|uniref:Uncharacterized protein n=1 Tax=Rhizobium daejeonense TaxID=240521 RepID=A0A6M1S094_9HYPH|nr:hypothetical protein [Rhizobium daejeonense]NGO62460.1 hypothetical protein [Rhizobium daejeonense]